MGKRRSFFAEFTVGKPTSCTKEGVFRRVSQQKSIAFRIVVVGIFLFGLDHASEIVLGLPSSWTSAIIWVYN